MKDTFYFSHDYNARTDPKIKRLMAKHGMTGYGIYWAIIEDLYNNANALQTDCESIAYDLRVDSEIIKSIIFDFDLFKIDGEIFSSLSIQRRLDDRNEKSEKARKSAQYRWNKKLENANAMRTQSDGNAIKERKGKERKLNTPNGVLLSSNKNDDNNHSGNVPIEKIIQSWNERTKLSKVNTISESRKKAIRARWNEHGRDNIWKVFKKTFESDFLNGKNESNWMASFDWVMNPTNFVKILDGNYDNREKPKTNGKRYNEILPGDPRYVSNFDGINEIKL
jgi:hypothetical protein